MEIKDRTFIITGSGSGLGSATARRLVASGGRVSLADLNAETGTALAAELGPEAVFVQVDVTDEASARAAIETCRQKFGDLHGLINCAGVAPSEKVVGRNGPHQLDTFVRTIQINLVGTFNMLRLAAAAIMNAEPDADGARGVIVNTASIAAFEGQIVQAAYAASKGGVVAMTLAIARELARSGIRVLTLAPGIFETPMMAAMPEDVQDSLGKSVPFPQRMGRPDEFAGLVAHIIENSYLNGEVIRLDGSIRMAAK